MTMPSLPSEGPQPEAVPPKPRRPGLLESIWKAAFTGFLIGAAGGAIQGAGICLFFVHKATAGDVLLASVDRALIFGLACAAIGALLGFFGGLLGMFTTKR